MNSESDFLRRRGPAGPARPRAPCRPQRARRLAACCLALALAGCASEASRQRAQLDDIMRRLPGEYDDRAQAQSAAGGDVAVNMLIAPLRSMIFGDKAFYVRESAADDPRRVLGQGIWVFAQDKDGHIEQTVYLFKQPRRWMGVADDPDMLLSLLPGDVLPLDSCTLLWSKSATGFEAARKPQQHCRPGPKAAGALVDQSLALRGDKLEITAQQVGTDGQLRAGTASLYRFERHGSSADADDKLKAAQQSLE